jgi:hypothetical protein
MASSRSSASLHFIWVYPCGGTIVSRSLAQGKPNNLPAALGLGPELANA